MSNPKNPKSFMSLMGMKNYKYMTIDDEKILYVSSYMLYIS